MEPSSLRVKIEARSKRNPSTCICFHPKVQAVDDHFADVTVRAVQGVSCPGVVAIVDAIGLEQIVGIIINAPVAVRGSLLISFRRMVINGVEDHLNLRRVHGLDHPPEFIDHLFRGLGNRIFVMGREEIQRHISPVTAFLGILLEHREQLYRRNSELLQVRDLL